MIIIRLVGGLGNQLFQYALGRHLSLINNQELKIDTSYYSGATPNAQKGIRVYGLDNFNISATEASEAELRRSKKFFKSTLLARGLRKINRMRNFVNCYYMVEPENLYWKFQPSVLNKKIAKDVYIEGYWQTEKYFIDIEPIIRRELSFKNTPDEVNMKLINEIKNENSIALHIRHGDNANEYAKAHGVLPLDYYYKAINIIANKIENPSFYIFSDDPEWARENLKLDFQTQYISHNGDIKNYEDLRLMSNCKHHIIGNSTFSWWGAWLGKKANQIVIAPKYYQENHDISQKDFYPDNWIII